jgi:hypothetical protein
MQKCEDLNTSAHPILLINLFDKFNIWDFLSDEEIVTLCSDVEEYQHCHNPEDYSLFNKTLPLFKIWLLKIMNLFLDIW